MSQPASATKRSNRWAFTLVEVLVATMITGVLLVVALRTVGNSVVSERTNANRCQGLWLAEQLMSEILTASYIEPVETPVFGPEAGEDASGNRSGYDDVDDYHGWPPDPPRPPEEKDGTPLPDLAGWQRSVSVVYVDPDAFETVLASDQGVKLIIVSVDYNDSPIFTLQCPVTDAWQPPPY